VLLCCPLADPGLRGIPPMLQGDDVEIYIMTKDGIATETLSLKRD
jgi:hypothetical protein